MLPVPSRGGFAKRPPCAKHSSRPWGTAVGKQRLRGIQQWCGAWELKGTTAVPVTSSLAVPGPLQFQTLLQLVLPLQGEPSCRRTFFRCSAELARAQSLRGSWVDAGLPTASLSPASVSTSAATAKRLLHRAGGSLGNARHLLAQRVGPWLNLAPPPRGGRLPESR